jgi:hypothetical protein
MAIAALALTAASTGASLYTQNQQMHAQEDANQKQYDNTMTAYRTNLANIEVSRNQATADATQKLTENNAAGRAAQASATVAAGEGGISGTSVNSLLRDLAGRAAYDNTNVEENYLRQNQSLNAKRENVFNSTVSDINQLQTPQAPDYLGAAFRIGSAGLNAYGQTQKYEAIKRGDRTGGGW